MNKWEDKYEKLKNGEFDARIDELKDKCNPRKRSIIGVQSGLLYIYSSSKLNFLHNVEMADIGSKNAHLFFFWPAAFVILFLVSSY